jgi:hypothetical protein
VCAAHKLVYDENGDVLYISKECFSNGCAATVDVSYPSIPLFLCYNPELVRGMMRPIFRFARTDEWEFDFSPIEENGASYVDTAYTKAYLRHLFHAQELLALQIASIHNLAFYLWLVGEARQHIIAGDFTSWKAATMKRISTRL